MPTGHWNLRRRATIGIGSHFYAAMMIQPEELPFAVHLDRHEVESPIGIVIATFGNVVKGALLHPLALSQV